MKGQTNMYGQMASNQDIFRPQTATGRFLLWIWDMVDISENMGRVEDWTTTISNGFSAAVHAVVFFVMTVAALALTWYFDIQSTIEGMSSVTNTVVPSLPGQVAHLATWVVLAMTFMPTFLELFTSGMAKFNIKVVQVAIIAFTLFDMVTDIPRTYQLALGMWPQIDAMGWGISHITFWLYFIGWLFFATLGFELGTVLFAYATIRFIIKTFSGEGSFQAAPRRNRMPRQKTPMAQSVRESKVSGFSVGAMDDDVIVIE